MIKHLKLNREVNLLELGIKKPLAQQNHFVIKGGIFEEGEIEDPSE